MYEFFCDNYISYLIEESKYYLIFLIPGIKLNKIFNWYGVQRAKSFNSLSTKTIINDIEERDNFYEHMIIWDKELKELAGGQRFLFSKKGYFKNKNHSYLEEYHKGTFNKLKDISFCEIGRTFIMPKFQNKKLLKELIRGFVKIPQELNMQLGIGLISFNNKILNEKSVNLFLKYLESSKSSSIEFPEGKYALSCYVKEENLKVKYKFELKNFSKIEREIKKLDSKFKFPPVLKPYIKFCGLKYEGFSVAKDYNNIIQLLFSGRYNEVDNFPMKKFKPFKIL